MTITGLASQSPLLDTFKVTGFEKWFAAMASQSPPPTQNPFRIHPAKCYSELMRVNSEANSKLLRFSDVKRIAAYINEALSFESETKPCSSSSQKKWNYKLYKNSQTVEFGKY